jgi:putative YphP/YqiW family bacilliredoxin
MWQELDTIGVKPLTTAEEVDQALSEKAGTTLMVVNSVCGCAAGAARPAIALALQNKKIPDRLYTVFAGVDREATERARRYMTGIPPSSPSAALFKDGKPVHMVNRHDIEGIPFGEIVQNFIDAFNANCGRKGPSVAPGVVRSTFNMPENILKLVSS